MNQVPAAVDIRPHLGVPAAGAMAEMNPRFDQVLDKYGSQTINSSKAHRLCLPAMAGERPALVRHCGQRKSIFPIWTVQEGKPSKCNGVFGERQWGERLKAGHRGTRLIWQAFTRLRARAKDSYPAWTRTRNEGTKNPCVTITPPGRVGSQMLARTDVALDSHLSHRKRGRR